VLLRWRRKKVHPCNPTPDMAYACAPNGRAGLSMRGLAKRLCRGHECSSINLTQRARGREAWHGLHGRAQNSLGNMPASPSPSRLSLGRANNGGGLGTSQSLSCCCCPACAGWLAGWPAALRQALLAALPLALRMLHHGSKTARRPVRRVHRGWHDRGQ